MPQPLTVSFDVTEKNFSLLGVHNFTGQRSTTAYNQYHHTIIMDCFQDDTAAQLKLVADLNNAGLVLVRFGDFIKAASYFDKATAVVDETFPFDYYQDCDMTQDELPIDVSPSLVGSDSANCHEQSLIGIFDRAFFLKRDDLSSVAESSCARLYASIALHFNLGLCFHLQGMALPSSESLFLEMAKSQYQVACGLLDSGMDQREALLLHFALINNLASVCAQLSEMSDAKRWLEDLRFAYSTDADSLDKTDLAICRVLRCNLMIGSDFTSHHSAAA